nr:sigma-70 family RNA polymerase sigma factor [Bacillus oleivorans]
MDSFNPGKNSFKHWIAAIAKYKAIDYQRRQITIHHKQYSVADINETPINLTQAKAHDRIEEILGQLSESERMIFEKYYLEGTPSREIAKEFNEKESWIYNKLSRGRKKLRKFIIQKHEV